MLEAIPPTPSLKSQDVSCCPQQLLLLARGIKAAQITCHGAQAFRTPSPTGVLGTGGAGGVCVSGGSPQGTAPQRLDDKSHHSELLNGKRLNRLMLEFLSDKSWLEVSKFPHHRLGFLRKRDSVRFSFKTL